MNLSYSVSIKTGQDHTPALPVTGDFVLATLNYDAPTTGTATFTLENLILGDIQGQAILGVIAPNPHAEVMIFDPNA